MIDRKYLAGLFDGRGHIELLENGGMRVHIRMGGDVPMLLKEEFGGTCFKNGKKWWFRVQGENARFLLSEILPYLRVTKKRVKKLMAKNGL